MSNSIDNFIYEINEIKKQNENYKSEIAALKEEIERVKICNRISAFERLCTEYSLLLYNFREMEHSKNANAYALEQKLDLAISLLSIRAAKKYGRVLYESGAGGDPGPSIFEAPPLKAKEIVT